MFNTKCGCPTCRGENPVSRLQWKKRTNKHGRSYGQHSKGKHGKHSLGT